MNSKITVTVYPPDDENNEPLQAVNPSGPFFNTFVNDQNLGEGKGQFMAETTAILSHCNPSIINGPTKPVVHLALGYVQSGKTMSFTALSALALDNGYKMIIYLAGVTNNLLKQTADRLYDDLVGKHAKNRINYKIYQNPQEKDAEYIRADLEAPCQRIVLIPVLKQNNRIDYLSKLLKNPSIVSALKNRSVIIIDDEADQASLNGWARKNGKKGTDNKTATYEAIFNMISALPGYSYVQYTATPQANLLIDLNDILSPRSHTVLTPGKSYVGGKHFFGYNPPFETKTPAYSAKFDGNLITEIPSKDVLEKDDAIWTKLPSSLKKALKMHVIATALVVSWRNTKQEAGDDLEKSPENFLSMLIHIDRRVPCNKEIQKLVSEEMHTYRQQFMNSPNSIQYKNAYNAFESVFLESTKLYKTTEIPSFEELVPHIIQMLNDHKVYLINSDADADKITKETWNSKSMHILVGADMLNRGFTVEKLATTYMTRHSKAIPNADTVEQRCRFFGYKSNYIESCRVFLNKTAIDYYKDYVISEEEMRSVLSQYGSLEKVTHCVMLNPRLKPTRANILSDDVRSEMLKETMSFMGIETDNFISVNKRTVDDFLSLHPYNAMEDTKYFFSGRQPHRGFNISISEAISFIKNFLVSKDVIRRSGVIRVLQNMDENKNHVHVVEMDAVIPQNTEHKIRVRHCDPQTMETFGGLQAGHSPGVPSNSPKYYPGDRAIVEQGNITIQIYRIELSAVDAKFPPVWTAGRPNIAACIAVSIPKELTTRFIGKA